MSPPVGQTLREARTQQGIELDEVQRATRIRVRYLRAMESEEWDELPGPAYARGFLDTYARFLGLDADALVQEFKSDHETALPLDQIPEEMLPKRGDARGSPRRRRTAVVVGALLAAAALGTVALVALTGDSQEGGPRKAGQSRARSGEQRTTPSTSGSTTTSASPAAEPDEVSVALHSTAEVWVCLVDERGRPLVNGEILSPDEARGPFRSASFDVTLGNGAIDIDAGGEPISIPDAAEPLSYRITPEGSRRIDPGSGPSCT
jgi:cytoskeleton protein RodZ